MTCQRCQHWRRRDSETGTCFGPVVWLGHRTQEAQTCQEWTQKVIRVEARSDGLSDVSSQ